MGVSRRQNWTPRLAGDARWGEAQVVRLSAREESLVVLAVVSLTGSPPVCRTSPLLTALQINPDRVMTGVTDHRRVCRLEGPKRLEDRR
jgi:hypothetical protein